MVTFVPRSMAGFRVYANALRVNHSSFGKSSNSRAVSHHVRGVGHVLRGVCGGSAGARAPTGRARGRFFRPYPTPALFCPHSPTNVQHLNTMPLQFKMQARVLAESGDGRILSCCLLILPLMQRAKVCQLVLCNWGTSLGADERTANDRMLTTNFGRKACVKHTLGKQFPRVHARTEIRSPAGDDCSIYVASASVFMGNNHALLWLRCNVPLVWGFGTVWLGTTWCYGTRTAGKWGTRIHSERHKVIAWCSKVYYALRYDCLLQEATRWLTQESGRG